MLPAVMSMSCSVASPKIHSTRVPYLKLMFFVLNSFYYVIDIDCLNHWIIMAIFHVFLQYVGMNTCEMKKNLQ